MRVLYVSKPVQPPWHDGSKNLVRDLAEHVPDVTPVVLTGAEPVALAARVVQDPVYRAGKGSYAPALRENARVLQRLLRAPREDLWHFVFAPNPASSTAAHLALAAQRLLGRRPRVVQTVASAPRSYAGVQRLLFGDVVVAQSEDTRTKLLAHGATAEITVIPPCARAPEQPSSARRAQARLALPGLGARYVLYPGDFETSTGAATVLAAAPALVAAGFDVVLACREKTERARQLAHSHRQALPAELANHVHFAGTVADLPALLAGALAVAFPVDDLYGKVDLPLVLLEALALGVPLVVARGGPLPEIEAAQAIPPESPAALAEAVARLEREPVLRDAVIARGRAEYERRFTPDVVGRAYGDLYRRLCR